MADISKVTLPDGSEYNIKGKSAECLTPAHILSGEAGWYEFIRIPDIPHERRNIMILISEADNFYTKEGIIKISYYDGGAVTYGMSTGHSYSADVNWLSTHFDLDDVRYKTISSQSTFSFVVYIKKTSSISTNILFYLLGQSDGSQFDNTNYWVSTAVEEPTTATSASGDINNNAATAINATNDTNGDQIDTTYLKKTETAHSSYTLFPTKVYPGTLAAGWYKFAEVNITTTTGRAKITFKYGLSNSNYDFIGEIFIYKTNSTTMNCSIQIPYSISGKTTYFRYNIDSATTVSLYVYKHDSSGVPVFTFITSEDINGNYLDPSTYMLESLVAETPPATALKPIYSAISRWIYNVSISPGTNQQILSYSHNMITSATVLAKIEFANPDYIKSDCSWETTDGTNPNDVGTITLTGTCTTATTANLLLLNVVEG